MTLSRQLMLSGLFILLSLYAGMIMFVVKNTQSFMDHQLASHSQDTATALGLTLTTIMKNNDLEVANRTVDAIWDRGYYKSIRIETSDGTTLVERFEKVKIYGVPQWFVQALDLKTTPKEALIMDGWKVVGRVKIESNPGFAYRQIWSTFLDSSLWLLIISLIAALLGSGLLYIILKPLRAITQQAMAICNQQFPIQKKLPWTLDLRLVVEAMNTMSLRLKSLFEKQAQASELLREQAYKDPVTKVGNRQFFDIQFDYLLKDKEKGGMGALLLIEIQGFKEYNDKFGYQEGDSLLRHVGTCVKYFCQEVDDTVIARAAGASFFIILPNRYKETSSNVASQICHAFASMHQEGLSQQPIHANVGITLFYVGDNKKDILSKADMALRTAQSQGQNGWHFIEEIKKESIHGAQEWAAIFDQVIQENRIILHYQETQLWVDPQLKMYEALMRLKLSEDEIIPAGTFLSMAEKSKQILALDKIVIEKVVEKIKQSESFDVFSVNLSPSSLTDVPFKHWLIEQVKMLGKKAKCLTIEYPEYGVVNHIDEAREFFLKFSANGGKTAIDHYGKNFSSFSYLFNLKLTYLKIDGGYIKNVHLREENQFFIRSLVDIAHSLGIMIIAEAVENEEEYETLKQLKIDGVQGYYIARPAALN